MNELLELYHEFFEKLSALEEGYPEPIDAATSEEIDELAAEFNLHIPEDLRSFWCTPKMIYSVARYDDEEWEAGFDFCAMDIIRRDIPMYRDELAPNYDDIDPLKQLHSTGVPISYSEPALIYNADPNLKKSDVYLLMWDGESSFEPIAPDFTTFFKHWLASGCFRGREFKKYWEVVKDFVPVQIPLEENLWLKYYDRVYKDEYPIF